MSYLEEVEKLCAGEASFRRALEILKQSGGCRVLNFSHNDIDGVCSALLLKRAAEALNAEVFTVMPPYFELTKEEVTGAIRRAGTFDLMIISDKGTFRKYDDFTELIPDVLIIDHHQPVGDPQKCVVFNPVWGEERAPATALLCHMLVTELGVCGDFEDFACAVGCVGDLAFNAVTGKCQKPAEPFLEYARQKFPELFKISEGEPTMFDTDDRTRTAQLHRIAEVVHAGTLAHLYSGDIGGEIKYGPDFVLNFLEQMGRAGACPKSVEELFSAQDGGLIRAVYKEFKEDWKSLESRVKDPIFLGKVKDASVYLIFAREAKRAAKTTFSAILPFVASAHMKELKRNGEVVLIVFSPKEVGTHISMRTDGKTVDCGNFLHRLEEILREKYPGEKVSGGGHDRAAGFFASSGVPLYRVLHELVFMLEEILTEAAV